ncbi:MAG: hypothetical protein V9G04_16995 [Nocardioides sp.]|jgi:hypothetical protein
MTAVQTPTFVLPGKWWRVDLRTPETVRQSIRSLTKSAMPGDQFAQVRAEMLATTASAAEQAANAGAVAFHLALEIVPGLPIPLTLAVYLPEMPMRLSSLSSGLASAESLGEFLRADGSVVSAWAEGEHLGVARAMRVRSPATEELGATDVLHVDYWLVCEGSSATAVLSFSAPVLWEVATEAMLSLMDAVVSTVTWEPDRLVSADEVL